MTPDGQREASERAVASEPTASGYALPASWLVALYLGIFAAFGLVVNLNWKRLSLVQNVSQIDANVRRLIVTRQDSLEPQLSVEHRREGFRLKGGGLRGIQVTALAPRLERPCKLDVPHRHSATVADDELVVAFAARTARPATEILVSLGLKGPRRDEPIPEHLAIVPLSKDWQEVRLKVGSWQPHGPFPSAVNPIASLLLDFKPSSDFDLWLREPRFLAQPLPATGLPTPPSPNEIQ